MTGRYAISFINIEIPPDQVDVNVHPTKMEVRFADGGRIYSQLLGTIRSKFLATNLTSGATKPAIQSEPAHPVRSPHANAEQRRMAFDFSGTGKARQDATGAAIAHTSGGPTSELPAFRPFPRGPGYPSPVPRANHAAPQTKAGGTVGVAFSDEGAPAMQVYNRYLITETDEGVVVIDQHALHERILYEELRRKILSSNLESQKLLVPEPVQLTSAECSAILEQREVLTKLGIEVESIASSTLLVLAYPALLANLGPAEILRQAADKITDTTDEIDPRDLCDELLHMISCKAAIKAGDPLTRSEVAELLRQRHLCQDAHHCPHGRPTTLVFSRTELDRRFKRT